MPRKKRTRAGRTKLSRPAKAVEKQMEDLSDVSMISEGQTKDELLAIFLQDFDNGVEKRVKQLRAEMAKLITDTRNILRMEQLKIPMEIRQMKLTDFLKEGGNMDELMLHGAEAVTDDAAIAVESASDIIASNRNPLQEIPSQSNTKSTVRRSTRKATRPTKTPMTKNEGRMTRAQMRAIANSNNETPAKQMTDFVTPMNPVMLAKSAFKTPMITPKFDPTHPVTTGRRPKLGETLVSLAGSPVISGNQGNANEISVQNGKNPVVFNSFLSNLSPNSLVNFRSILDSKIEQNGKETAAGKSG